MLSTTSKRIGIIFVVVLLVLTNLASISYAGEFESAANETQPNIGVSTVCPDDEDLQTKSVNRPSKVWNIASKGKYTFSGNPGSQTLYTNFKFKGKTSYTFYVKNSGKYSMTVKAKRLTKTYASTRISAGKSASVTFSNIKKDTEFYLTFEGSSFSGYIK